MMHWPGIEPGSTAWEAAMLTSLLPMLECAITTMLLLQLPKGKMEKGPTLER